MSRLIQRALLLTALAVSASACQAAIITPPGPIDPIPVGDEPAEIFARDVEPLLVARCEGCHADPSATEHTFLAGDYYMSVLAYTGLVVAGDPSASLLINKGEHRARPWWNATEVAAISAWIDAEDPAMMPPDPPPPDLPATSPYPVEAGANRIPLAEAGLPSAEIVFNATVISSGMMLRDIFFEAGGTGISISHPRFVIWEGASSTMDTDRFSEVEINVSAGSGGLLTDQHILAGFPIDGALSIQFGAASTM